MVSIVIPAYNCSKYIKQCVQSCNNQIYDSFEIIVIDDNSSDDLYQFTKNFNIRYIRNDKNIGPGASRNIGIKVAKGEYISFLDCDDLMNPNKLELSVRAFEEDDKIGMVCGNYQILVDRVRLCHPFYQTPIDIDYDLMMKQNFVASGSTTVKKSVFDDIGLFNEEYWIAEDYDMWVRISEKYKIKYIHEVLYYYSIVSGDSSLTQRADIQMNHIKNIKKIKEESKKRVFGDKFKK